MKKILNFLLVRRPEVENKWWDRLFKVLLFGSSILLFIAVLGGIVSEKRQWITYESPYMFSLEPNYHEFVGKEFSCESSLNTSNSEDVEHPVVVKCEDVNISYADSIRYEELEREEVNKIYKEFGFDKYSWDDCPVDTTKNRMNCIKEKVAAERADTSYSDYMATVKKIPLNVKVARNVHFSVIFVDIIFWLVVSIVSVLLWIIFWSSIIYRSILYIIFGKKK